MNTAAAIETTIGILMVCLASVAFAYGLVALVTVGLASIPIVVAALFSIIHTKSDQI